MALHRRSPRALAIALGPLQSAVSPDTPLAQLQTAWPAAVGPLVAGEAAPVAERAGTVTVACSAAVWAQELDLIAPDIVERLNAGLTTLHVRALRCVVRER